MKFYIRLSSETFFVYPENQVKDASKGVVTGSDITVGSLVPLNYAHVKNMAQDVSEWIRQIKFLRSISGLGLKEAKDASQSGLVARISLEQDQGLVYLIQALVRLDDEVAQNVIHARRPCLGPLASEADQAARTVARNFSTSVWRRSACSPRC